MYVRSGSDEATRFLNARLTPVDNQYMDEDQGRPSEGSVKGFPFIMVGVLAFATSLVPPVKHDEIILVGTAAASTVLIGLLVARGFWQRKDGAILPFLLFLVPVALLREAEGGASSGYAPLALLPVLWLCLTGTRRQMYVAFAGASAVLLLPMILIGGARYPASEWRRWIILLAVGAVMGEAVLELRRKITIKVEELRSRSTELEAATDILTSVQRVARTLADGGDIRQTTCAGARRLTNADIAVFIEVDSAIEITAWDGGRPSSTGLSLSHGPCAALEALSTKRRVVVETAEDVSDIDGSLAELTGASIMIFQPIIRRGAPIGVLGTIWRTPIEESEGIFIALELLADEAAIAIEQNDLIEALDNQVRTDELTGLPNRRALDEALHRQLNQRSKGDRRVVVAFIDLDHFKRFNDRHGHQAGDLFLKEATAAWRQELRSDDTLFRYGGEEFVAILPQCSEDDAVRVMDRLRVATPSGESSSVGVASWTGMESAQELLRRADEALYTAKATGRARTIVAQVPLNVSTSTSVEGRPRSRHQDRLDAAASEGSKPHGC